jgi:hypothetical protein
MIDRPRTVAFYLPQYHVITENSAWWGEGFTDWTNVRRAKPLFEGHDQPRVPTGLGYYDLSEVETLRRQVELARAADIDAFCIYFYWFDGRRLLERPLELYRTSGIDFPYCLCWANEAWTRRWDGKDADVLMPQSYGVDFARDVFADLVLHFKQPNYLMMDGRPILVVHRADQIPDVRPTTDVWRRLAREHGLPGIYLIAAETKPGSDPRYWGFDALAEFPPVGSNTLGSALAGPRRQLVRSFRGRLLSYERLSQRFISRQQPVFELHRGVTPGWDNTPRRGNRATIYVGSSPRAYARWLAAARSDEARRRGNRGLVFVNAWNEWAEGAYLEPDQSFGSAYLEATRWYADPVGLPSAQKVPQGGWSASQLRSLLLLTIGSLLATYRRTISGLLARYLPPLESPLAKWRRNLPW